MLIFNTISLHPLLVLTLILPAHHKLTLIVNFVRSLAFVCYFLVHPSESTFSEYIL